jgi:hypothetical protein
MGNRMTSATGGRMVSHVAPGVVVAVLLCLAARAPAGVDGDAGRVELPAEGELKKLTATAMLAFSDGVRAKDFVAFHAAASTPFREQVSAERMREAFNEFIEKGVDLSRVKGAEPIFDRRPALVQDGKVLELVGHYETPPVNPHFSLKFYHEDGQWKLLGINVDLRAVADPNAERPKRPAEAELRKLVKQTLLDFNDAVKSRDFSGFHARCSAPLRQQIPPDKLRQAFQAFIDRKVDISAIRDLDPSFDVEPTVDGDGVLAMSGQYPTRPIRTAFQVKYFLENGEWKLLGVSVDTTEPEGPLPE